ncbi:MAG: EamA family transporter RarD [Coriobacteriia bacterium]|nr:EamA family transporter RarD [Coriobacteriia bacterium]
MTPAEKKGTLASLGCYIFWGLCPLYWKLLQEANSLEIIAHRIIWCAVLTIGACAVLRLNLPALLRTKRAWAFLVPAAVLITINWGTYIYAVNINNIIETSLGYYINPLVSILLGMVLFRERLTKPQTIAVVLCAVGVVYFTLNYGQFPWIALTLALTFGTYGAVKKRAGYPAIQALAMENVILVLPAIAFAVGLAFATGQHAFLGDTASAHGWIITLLLVGSGAITAIPLLLFAHAANNIPLSLLGFVQFLSPTIALLLGVFAFGEPFTQAHAVCLGCIWVGLALVTAESLFKSKRLRF